MTKINTVFLVVSLLVTSGMANSAPWPYDPAFQPIAKKQIAAIITNPKTTAAEHEILRGRTGTSHLMEYAAALYDQERKKRPNEPLLQSAFCYTVFVSQSGDYKPSDKALFEKQLKTLWYPASQLADEVARKAGAKIPFCIRADAYQNIEGIGQGWKKGVEKAEKALSLNPNDSYTLRLLAYAQTRRPLGDPDKAIDYARQVVQLAPKSSKGNNYLYLAYARKEDYVNAFRYLQLAQKQMPPQNRSKTALTTFKILAERQAKGQKSPRNPI